MSEVNDFNHKDVIKNIVDNSVVSYANAVTVFRIRITMRMRMNGG
jgi:hypothetical protein